MNAVLAIDDLFFIEKIYLFLLLFSIIDIKILVFDSKISMSSDYGGCNPLNQPQHSKAKVLNYSEP
jgi:hypothetical protein